MRESFHQRTRCLGWGPGLYCHCLVSTIPAMASLSNKVHHVSSLFLQPDQSEKVISNTYSLSLEILWMYVPSSGTLGMPHSVPVRIAFWFIGLGIPLLHNPVVLTVCQILHPSYWVSCMIFSCQILVVK